MLERRIRNIKVKELLWSFILYGCVGWVIEMIVCAIEMGQIVDRGFLNIPHCPVYGFGIVLLLLVLGPLKNRPVWLFVVATVLINTLEYFTGVALEVFFDRRWWDYSDHFLNLNGFITLPIGILWGLASVAVVRYIQPRIRRQIEEIDPQKGRIFLLFFYTVFVIDNFRVFYELILVT
jgi:uncharacterized membrane protein